jgi:hypothetical protein
MMVDVPTANAVGGVHHRAGYNTFTGTADAARGTGTDVLDQRATAAADQPRNAHHDRARQLSRPTRPGGDMARLRRPSGARCASVSHSSPRVDAPGRLRCETPPGGILCSRSPGAITRPTHCGFGLAGGGTAARQRGVRLDECAAAGALPSRYDARGSPAGANRMRLSPVYCGCCGGADWWLPVPAAAGDLRRVGRGVRGQARHVCRLVDPGLARAGIELFRTLPATTERQVLL